MSKLTNVSDNLQQAFLPSEQTVRICEFQVCSVTIQINQHFREAPLNDTIHSCEGVLRMKLEKYHKLPGTNKILKNLSDKTSNFDSHFTCADSFKSKRVSE